MFIPQKTKGLNERFKKIIKELQGSPETFFYDEKYKGDSPELIFDTESGVRIKISGYMLNNVTMIHFSAETDDRFYSKKGKNKKRILEDMVDAFIEISGCDKKHIKLLDAGLSRRWCVPLINVS